MADLERILRECFWDLQMTADELERILQGEDDRRKRFVFEKILLNSSNYLRDLQLFDRRQLYRMLTEMKVPEFNRDYILRRKNIAEVFFFDLPLHIKELQWNP